MDLLFEIFFEIYIELMMYIVPEEKSTSKVYRVIAVLVALVALLGILALFVWGVVLLEHGKMIGWVPISISVVLSLVQIFAGFALRERKKQ